MPWTIRGQYCAYCTSYLSSGNLSRHLETCARFDGRFSVDRAKEALELEQKHKAKYTTKYVLSRSEVYEILGEFVLQTTTEEQNLNEFGATLRKEDAKQKPSIINGNSSVEDTSTQYAPLFPSMKLIVDRYASLNENARDVSRFQRP